MITSTTKTPRTPHRIAHRCDNAGLLGDRLEGVCYTDHTGWLEWLHRCYCAQPTNTNAGAIVRGMLCGMIEAAKRGPGMCPTCRGRL